MRLRILTILVLTTVLIGLSAKAQDKIKVINANGAKYVQSDHEIHIRYLQTSSDSERRSFESIDLPPGSSKFKEDSNEGIVNIGLGQNTDSLFNRLIKSKIVAGINPVYVSPSGMRQVTTNRILAKLKSEISIKSIAKLLSAHKVISYTESGYSQNHYTLIADKRSGFEMIDIANSLNSTGYFEYVEPDFKRYIIPSTADEYFGVQYYLSSINNSDIKAEKAWQITTGSPNIKVAVLDIGIDLTHPDLSGNIVTGYNATDDSPNNLGAYTRPDDSHGTVCAGVLAAQSNTIGIVGVANTSKIMSIKISKLENATNSGWVTYDSWMAAGIYYAWVNGADVLSMSFRWGGIQSSINEQIHNAVTLGRGGLGCQLISAAGNDNLANILDYPSSNSEVIAVGGTNYSSTRWFETSTFAANYGTGLDVSAPSGDIVSTDIQGNSAGFNRGTEIITINGNTKSINSNYAVVRGTSLATPMVAGVMALMYSIDPTLTQANARTILESTCDKVGGYNYQSGISGQPNGTWSSELGYGRVNACLAVLKTAILKNIPSQAICSTYQFGNFTKPSGVSVQYTSGTPTGLAIDSNGLATRNGTFSGFVTITCTVTGSCGSLNLSFQVYVGLPDRPGSIIGNPTPSSGSLEFYYASGATAATSYNWVVPVDWSIDHYNTPLSIFTWVGSSQGQIQVISANNCGNGGSSRLFVTPTGGGGCNPCQIGINPNPNPANSEIHVGLGGGSGLLKKVSLTNSNQEVVFFTETTEPNLIIGTANFPDGVYYLSVDEGSKTLAKHRVVIKH